MVSGKWDKTINVVGKVGQNPECNEVGRAMDNSEELGQDRKWCQGSGTRP